MQAATCDISKVQEAAPLTDKGVETEAVTSEMKLTIHKKFQDFPLQRFAEVLEYITALA
ncbi:unnamed protein product, partial [Cladocopium goreaui]